MDEVAAELPNEKKRAFLDSMVGIIPNTGDSVKEIRKIRERLSQEIKSPKDLEDLNALLD